MTFSNKVKPLRFPYGYSGTNITHVDEFKYLGVTFTHNLKWQKHIDRIHSKALRKLFYLNRTLKDATKGCKLTAYKTLIGPVGVGCLVPILLL